MRDFVFQNKTKVYFGKEQMSHLHEEVAQFGKKVLMVYGGGSIKRTGLYDKVMAKKACGQNGVLHGFTDLTPADVENIYKMCL